VAEYHQFHIPRKGKLRVLTVNSITGYEVWQRFAGKWAISIPLPPIASAN
jgi:hypothetical protein